MSRYSVRVARWPEDRDKLRCVRYEVFVREQGVPEALEWDGRDADCLHVLAEDAHGAAIGCGRLLPDGHIGRMAVLPAWRRRGIGAALLAQLLDGARRRGLRQAILHAQTSAAPFYAAHGFRVSGPEFMEAGLAHVEMRKTL